MTDADDPYLAVHVRERLVADDRIGEQDLQTEMMEGTVVITGEVSTEERRQAVSQVAAETLGGTPHRNLVSVAHNDGPVETERLS
ncbi:MAG TPA: BON domain-containing protein [Acidimicrobiales bacterium]